MTELLLNHLDDHYRFYGERTGVRTARKHIGWYLSELPNGKNLIDEINLIDSTVDQHRILQNWLIQQENVLQNVETNCDNVGNTSDYVHLGTVA